MIPVHWHRTHLPGSAQSPASDNPEIPADAPVLYHSKTADISPHVLPTKAAENDCPMHGAYPAFPAAIHYPTPHSPVPFPNASRTALPAPPKSVPPPASHPDPCSRSPPVEAYDVPYPVHTSILCFSLLPLLLLFLPYLPCKTAKASVYMGKA